MASTARMVRLCMMYAVPVQYEIVMLTYRNLFFFLCRNCRLLIKATSSVLMTLDRKVRNCTRLVLSLFGLGYPRGIFHMSSPSV